MRGIPVALASLYGVLGLLALIAIPLSDDGLGGVFLVVLGMPWVQLLGTLIDAALPQAFDNPLSGIVLGIAGTAVNTTLIYLVSRWVVTRLAPPHA
jgi:hypothetical protein